jgi:2-hydroxycyclohexanecarboxyl-CoA dehydrogenase
VSGHTAVVTGGASGIGLGVSRRLAADGNAIAVLDLDAAAAESAAAAIVAEGGRAIGLGADVADRAAVRAAYDAVREELGPIGIVVTSAGIESFDDVGDISDELWDRMIAVNLTGTFICLQLAIPDMVEAGWGRMVTISSSSAQSGAGRMAHYVAAKGGVISLTKGLAKELAPHRVTVNTIPPTVVDTPMARHAEERGAVPPLETLAGFIPLGRAGTPDDIAAACSFLCSDGGEYITGQVIGVNGGMYI